MQFFKVSVALAGDEKSTVIRDTVSVAEIKILETIHGRGSVTPLKLLGGKVISSADEKARLLEFYKTATNERGDQIVELVYPGFTAMLPATLHDIGMENPKVYIEAPQQPVEELIEEEPESDESEPEPTQAAPVGKKK